MRIALVVGVALVAACGSSSPSGPSADDPLGCNLPTPCAMGSFGQGSRELAPQNAAVCMYDALADEIAGGKPVHLTVQFKDTAIDTWDLYVNGSDPAVIVETQCEFDGPCSTKSIKRCVLKPASGFDCSKGTGPARVCGDPANDWCTSTREIDPATATCP
jgi:hypothetical protein